MSGKARLITSGVIAGYISIGVGILYAFFSVRLALHYLGKEEFGLWSLSSQIMGYLMLLELGVTGAVSRLLADHKDDISGNSYTGLLTAGLYLFGAQGLLVVIAGTLFSFLAPGLFAIPEHFRHEFTNLLLIITTAGGVSLALRFLGSPLWAFNRQDVSYSLSSLSLSANLLVLWCGFHLGWGIYSFAAAILPGIFLTPLVTLLVCRRNGYYPVRWRYEIPERNFFAALGSFAKDAFLMNFGNQLVNASQIMILSRFAGLEAAASFAVGVKMYALGQQCVVKVIENSAPALTEFYVRNAREQFVSRFWNALSLTVFLAAVGGTGLILGNSPLVKLWSSGSIVWSNQLDLILGLLLFATMTTRCLISLFGMAGNLRPVRFVYFLEGILFIALAIPAAIRFGLGGVLASSMIAHLGVTGALSVGAARSLLPSLRPMARPVFSAIGCLILAVACLRIDAFVDASAQMRLVISAGLMVPFAGIAWKTILTSNLRHEIAVRLKRAFLALPNQARQMFVS